MNVTTKLQPGVAWQNIFNLSMQVSSILVISVSINLDIRVTWNHTYKGGISKYNVFCCNVTNVVLVARSIIIPSCPMWGALFTWDQVITAPGLECWVSIAPPPPSVCHPHIFAPSLPHCLSHSSVIARSKVCVAGFIILTLIFGGPPNTRGTAYL